VLGTLRDIQGKESGLRRAAAADLRDDAGDLLHGASRIDGRSFAASNCSPTRRAADG
jgi:hypothetical protein